LSWFKVDDRLPTSRKMLRIPRSKRTAAIGLWTIAGAWSAHDLTDGFVPAFMIEEWGGTEADADELIRAGMWEADEHDGDPGYRFVNWDEYQPREVNVEAKREYERERKRQQRRDRNGKFAGRGDVPNLSHRDNAGTPAVNDRDSTVPVPSRPVPSHTNAQPTVAREPSRFPDWWTIWEKKKAKGDAEKAYKAALKKISHDDLMAKTRAYWDHVKASGTDLQYVPYPATWLRAEQWDDDLGPSQAPRLDPLKDW
jgi:hypothetical protein